MPRDQFTMDYLANEMAKCVRTDPEFRKPPTDRPDAAPFRLVGIVDGHAVVRRHRASLCLFALKDFDTWPETDKDGRPLNAD